MPVIKIPYNFTPRPYQIAPFNSITDTVRNALWVMHRRAGKDLVCVNLLAKEALKRKGLYLYMLPYYKQARLVVWEGVRGDGFKLLDHFHPSIVQRKENQQMVLDLKNGSTIRFVGSDNIDSIVGTNPVGIIFSEFSLHKPSAYHYLRPIVVENGGWMVFQGTPRGKNLFHKLDRIAQQRADWFRTKLTVDDTYRNDGTHVVSKEDIEIERANGMPQSLIDQEYYCSFEAGLVGAYYAELMKEIADKGQIGRVPYDDHMPVFGAWDLGVNDSMTNIFFQIYSSKEIRIINSYSNRHKKLGHYVNRMNSLGYSWGGQLFPHDVAVTSMQTGITRLEHMENLDVFNCMPVKRRLFTGMAHDDATSFVRSIISRCYFDETANMDLIEALKSYRRDFDDKNQTFRDHHVKDWSVHYADAMRMLAYGLDIIEPGMLDPNGLPTGMQALSAQAVLQRERHTNPDNYDPFDG